MQAINFVVRTPVGGTQSGVVSGEAGSSTIFLQENEQVSLHLGRHQMSGYARVGNDLVITLVDGREITLSGYFSDAGTAFLSRQSAVLCVLAKKYCKSFLWTKNCLSRQR